MDDNNELNTSINFGILQMLICIAALTRESNDLTRQALEIDKKGTGTDDGKIERAEEEGKSIK